MDKPLQRQKVLIGITKSNFGGAQRYVYDLAASLPTDEYDVRVLAGGGGILLDRLKTHNVATITLPDLGRDVSIAADIRSFFSIMRVLIAEKPDIFHINSSKMGLFGALAGRLTGVPHIIFTAHGWAFNEPRGRIARTLLYWLSCVPILLAHTTIANSHATKNDILSPRLRKRITVIHNGISFETPLLPRHDARKQLVPTLSEQTLLIGTIAELHPVKNLKTALHACAPLLKQGKTHYVILGEGEERTMLETEIERLGIAQYITLAGFVENAATYTSGFDLYLMPSLSEALSYALLEVGRAGVATVASSRGGIREIIANGHSGILVDPEDTFAITHALERLAQNEDERLRLGTALAHTVVRNFSLETMLKKTRALYSSWM